MDRLNTGGKIFSGARGRYPSVDAEAPADLPHRLALSKMNLPSRRAEMISSIDLPFRAMSTSPVESLEIARFATSPQYQFGEQAMSGYAVSQLAIFCAGTDHSVTKSPNDEGIVSRDDPLPNWGCKHAD